MNLISRFECTPEIVTLSKKERGIKYACIAVVALVGMVAFFMKAVSDAQARELAPFIASIILAIICTIATFAGWSTFAKREHAHIDESVTALREDIANKVAGAGVEDEDVREWMVECVWECFCGRMPREISKAYLMDGDGRRYPHLDAPVCDDETSEEDATGDRCKEEAMGGAAEENGKEAKFAYIMLVSREGTTARCELYKA